MTALLKAEGLLVERDDRLLFSNLAFSVDAGTVLQIAGPNGSGKTTLLRILAGLSTRYEGELYWRGEPLARQKTLMRRETLFFGHQAGFHPLLTPWENLHWAAGLHGVTLQRQDAEVALARIGLAGYEDQPCRSLSAGQQRRAALARLLVIPAELWILDEPFTAVDRHGVELLEGLLAEHARAGGSVIITTHHALEWAEGLQRLDLGGRY